MKILIAEDEVILREAMKEKLINSGFEVKEVADGLSALSQALAWHPDLILLDILMPKMDGMTMLKKLRQDKNWGAHAKVILLTNVSDTAKVAEGLIVGLDGAYEYLVKTDWSLDEIVVKIKERLKK
ncbi:MAG: response regulator [bacterium]